MNKALSFLVLSVFFVLGATLGLADNPQVLIETNYGDIVVELYPEDAPISVENFLSYADLGYYDGLIFHRVIDDFMIQGGGYDPNLVKQSTGDPIENESDNGLSNERGTIAMARTTDPDSATSQFYINQVDNPELDYSDTSDGYAVFGRVLSGMDVVDAIAAVATSFQGGMNDVPVETVLIERILRKLSDLEIVDPTDLNITGEPGADIALEVTVINSGVDVAINGDDPNAPFEVGLYLCHYTPFGIDDPNSEKVGSFTVASLAVEATQSETLSLTVPALSGTYYVRAMADSNDVVTEAREENNLGGIIELISEPNSPDLVIDDPNVASFDVFPAAEVSITVAVVNLGTQDAFNDDDPNGTFWVNVYLSDDPNFGASESVGEFTVESLEARGRFEHQVTFTAPSLRGTYYVRAVADDGNDIVEFSEDNNVGESVTVEVEIAENLTLNHFQVQAGRELTNDRFMIQGRFTADSEAMSAASEVFIKVGPFEKTLAKSAFVQRGSYPIYSYTAQTGLNKAILDLRSGRFILSGRDVDLTGLTDPAKVVLEFGSYYGWRDADEAIINGRKSIPMRLMQGVSDELRVDYFRYTSDSPMSYSRDTLTLQGGISTEKPDVDMTNKEVTVKWGTKSFEIAENKIKRLGNRELFIYRRGFDSGNIVSATFDFERCQFSIMLREVTSLGAPPEDLNVIFEVDDDVDFDETINVKSN